MGRKPGDVSVELKKSYASSASAQKESGVRVQLGRTMAVVYAPSGYKPPGDLGAVPVDSLELQHVHGATEVRDQGWGCESLFSLLCTSLSRCSFFLRKNLIAVKQAFDRSRPQL